MIYQVAGLVIVVTCLICGTWHWTAVRKERIISDRAERERSAYFAQQVFENESLKLYEDERQRRIAVETRLHVLEKKLKRAKTQMEKAKIKDIDL